LDESVQYGGGTKLLEERVIKTKYYRSKEIIEQLGNILSHPREYVQEENLLGQLSSYLLESYKHEGFEVQLRSTRPKPYLRRWFLSKVLTHGNLGESERILTTIIFQGNSEQERLLNLIISKIIKRKTFLLLETYELCRGIYPLYFPILPNVQDPKTEPRFLIKIGRVQRRSTKKSNRVRNPSAVGGKHRQGMNPLPTFTSGDAGPSNVDEIFLETLSLLLDTSLPV